MQIKSVVFASMIDYPGFTSTVLFVGDCNWDCEYCYNKQLNQNDDIDFQTQILPRLLERKPFIDHVVISGGECTLYDDLEDTIDILNDNGFTVGIHTNGSNPDVLHKILNKIEYVGMDIKMDYSNYTLLEDSIKQIINSGNLYEFRTTLYPKYATLEECIKIAHFLKKLGANEWVVQQYTNDFNKSLMQPYSKKEIDDIVSVCRNIINVIQR